MSSEIEKILSLGKFNRNRVGKYSIQIKIIMHYQNDGQIKGCMGNFIDRYLVILLYISTGISMGKPGHFQES